MPQWGAEKRRPAGLRGIVTVVTRSFFPTSADSQQNDAMTMSARLRGWRMASSS